MGDLSKFEEALNLINSGKGPSLDVENDIGLEGFILNTIETNLCSTINIKYELGDICVTLVYPSGNKYVTFSNHTHESYNDFCSKVFNIDINERYNCSRTANIKGVKTRVYAVMPPFVKTPNITISTTKIPPTDIKSTVPDALFDKIVHSNFIICGPSGSGKTYLKNYLLGKYIREDERIALIEEFGELIPPNKFTTSIIVPPPKPGEEHLLKFMTEQSNLMRLDAIYVGEIKGGEAWPFVVNLASGTRGGCTLHGETATQALSRLRALCKMSINNDEAINEFISKSINYIIVMKNKKIDSIYRLTGICNRNSFAMEEIAS